MVSDDKTWLTAHVHIRPSITVWQFPSWAPDGEEHEHPSGEERSVVASSLAELGFRVMHSPAGSVLIAGHTELFGKVFGCTPVHEDGVWYWTGDPQPPVALRPLIDRVVLPLPLASC